MKWRRCTKFDKSACALADRHYSRRKVGSPQFMPPGQTVVLLLETGDAVFGWWRPHPAAGIRQMNGLDGWTCTIFRNESSRRSSELILEAEAFLADCGPDGLITYVWDSKVKSANPGYCFKMAGYRKTGRSADGRKTLLQKPWPSLMQSAPRPLTRPAPCGTLHASGIPWPGLGDAPVAEVGGPLGAEKT
jgi:hypothetical protein